MIYIVLDKKTKEVIADFPSEVKGLKGVDVYPEFKTRTMQLVYSEMSIEQLFKFYDNIEGHFKIGKNGNLTEKTLEEKAASNALTFDVDLLERSEGVDEIEGASNAIKIVGLGLKLKLFKSIYDCQNAFKLLDDDLNQRILEKYSATAEVKLMKEYMDWLQEGQPENDKRQIKYKKMQDFVAPIKDSYKEVRQQLKAIIIPLKKEEEEHLIQTQTSG